MKKFEKNYREALKREREEALRRPADPKRQQYYPPITSNIEKRQQEEARWRTQQDLRYLAEYLDPSASRTRLETHYLPQQSSTTAAVKATKIFRKDLEQKKLAEELYNAVNTQNISKVIDILSNHNPDLNVVTKNGSTALHAATQHGLPQMINLLIKFGADVNQQDKNGSTALHAATQHGLPQMINLLINFGADVNQQDKNGSTPLHLAALHKDERIFNFLKTMANPTIRNNDNLTAAEVKAQSYLTDLLDELDTKPPKQNQASDTSTTQEILQARNKNLSKEPTSFKYDEHTQTGLSEEEISKIKEIFKEHPELKKLPRSSLIDKKFNDIKRLIDERGAILTRSHTQLLKEMLTKYMHLKSLLHQHNLLNLKYSIINSTPPYPKKAQPELHIVYRVTLGEGGFGKVKLSQNLNTKKISVAKIQDYNKNKIHVDNEEKILTELAKFLASTSKTEISITDIDRKTKKKTLEDPSIKSKHYLFSDYIEGNTLLYFLKENKDKPSKMLDGLLKGLQALKEMSDNGVVHTDGHFDNIVLGEQKAEYIDFGLSYINKQTKKANIQSNHIRLQAKMHNDSGGVLNLNLFKQHVASSNPWVAPEILDLTNNGFIDSSADIYAFGTEIKYIAGLFKEPLKNKLLAIATQMTTTDPKQRMTIDKCISNFELLKNEEEQKSNPTHTRENQQQYRSWRQYR